MGTPPPLSTDSHRHTTTETPGSLGLRVPGVKLPRLSRDDGYCSNDSVNSWLALEDPGARVVWTKFRVWVSAGAAPRCSSNNSKSKYGREYADARSENAMAIEARSSTTLDNLELRCPAHNAYEAERWVRACPERAPASRRATIGAGDRGD